MSIVKSINNQSSAATTFFGFGLLMVLRVDGIVLYKRDMKLISHHSWFAVIINCKFESFYYDTDVIILTVFITEIDKNSYFRFCFCSWKVLVPFPQKTQNQKFWHRKTAIYTNEISLFEVFLKMILTTVVANLKNRFQTQKG